MLATLDYNSAITHQYHDLERGKKSFDRFFGLGVITSVFLPRLIKKLNGILISHLLSTKGALIEINEIVAQLRENDNHHPDLTKPISNVNDLLILNISFLSDIEKIIEDDTEKKFPELVISQSVLSETIENIYSILRILKKANLKSPKETSEFAKDLSTRSVKSLEKVLYGN